MLRKVYSVLLFLICSVLLSAIDNYLPRLHQEDAFLRNSANSKFTFGEKTPGLQAGYALVKSTGGTATDYPGDLINNLSLAFANSWIAIKYRGMSLNNSGNFGSVVFVEQPIDDTSWAATTYAPNNTVIIDSIRGRFILPQNVATALDPNIPIEVVYYEDSTAPRKPEVWTLAQTVSQLPVVINGYREKYSTLFYSNDTIGGAEVMLVGSASAYFYQDVYQDIKITNIQFTGNTTKNMVRLYARDFVGNVSEPVFVEINYQMPQPVFNTIPATTDNPRLALSGTRGNNQKVYVFAIVGGVNTQRGFLEISSATLWSFTDVNAIPLITGVNRVFVRSVDLYGNSLDTALQQITFTPIVPQLTVMTPTALSSQTIKGFVGKGIATAKLIVNGTENLVTTQIKQSTLSFNYTVNNLVSGVNTLKIITIDSGGNQTESQQSTIEVIPSGNLVAEQIVPTWNGKELTIDWSSYTPTGKTFKYELTASANDINKNISTTGISTDAKTAGPFKSGIDSPYLTFHLTANDISTIIHKRIRSVQHTALVPFKEDYYEAQTLQQGTYTYTPGAWQIVSLDDATHYLGTISLNATEAIYMDQLNPTWKNYTYTARLRVPSSDLFNVSLLYRAQRGKYYEFNISGSKNVNTMSAKHQFLGTTISPVITANAGANNFFTLYGYTIVKLEVRFNEKNGMSTVRSYIGSDENTLVKTHDFTYPIVQYGGVGIKTTQCPVNVDSIEVRPIN